MTTREIGDIQLRKIRDCVWEIPQEDGMEVPARVLASESLLEEIAEDKTLEQLRNSTHLPGMVDHAICMPDGHQGYGFPVGGVGAVDAETGCISPGAVGYDINCLPGSTDVRLSFGRRASLDTLRDRFETERATVPTADGLVSSDIRLFTESGTQPVYELETADGATVEATGDHPFRTPDGLTELSALTPGERVAVCPFRGIEAEEPEPVTVVSRADLVDADASPTVIDRLETRGLVPLRTTDTELNRLLRLLGYHAGRGSLDETGVRFHGRPDTLQSIRDDLLALGCDGSQIASQTTCSDGAIESQQTQTVHVESEALRELFGELGATTGQHGRSAPSAPAFICQLTDWQRAVFYSGYFGAEMTAPTAGVTTGIQSPHVSVAGNQETLSSSREFLDEAAGFLRKLGIKTEVLETADGSPDGSTDELRLQLGDDRETLIAFFETVGYRYVDEKRRAAVAAISYLNRAGAGGETSGRADNGVRARADGGHPSVDATKASSESPVRTTVQDEENLTGRGQNAEPQSFEAFRERLDIGDDMTVSVRIERIELVGEKPVYDIGVTDAAHTFLANGFVVSNCGVRMMRTNLEYDDIRGREEELVDSLFANIPAGLGGGGVVQPGIDAVDGALERGVEWAVENGFGVEADLRHCEDEGRRDDACPEYITQKSKDRGKNQLGSLGSGNHFLEVQRVTDVFDSSVAETFGLRKDQIVVLIHCGSRGLGHQTCTDYLRRIETEHADLLEGLPDKELAAAPAGSQLATEYYGAMCAAINFAWVNRQLIMHQTREVFERVFDRAWQDMEMDLLYDVAHNIAKRETHQVNGEQRELYVHRKGATRAFPAGRPDVPAAYRDVGQPVIIPGSMGAGSYVLRGGSESLDQTFGSTAHGAGRLMSRTQAKSEYWGGDVQDDLRESQKVYVKAESGATIAEEAPGVYKDIDEVVRVSDALGIGDKVARTFPVCNIKG